MWFKNLHIFRFLQPVTVTAETLAEQLQHQAFQPCLPTSQFSRGWVSPLGQEGKSLVHMTNNCLMFTFRKEEKVLPKSVVREFVDERAREIEAQQNQKLHKRELKALKEEATQELLPRAFTRSTYTFAYIDVNYGWLLIDTPSAKRAEEIMVLLRNTLGSLPVVAPKTKIPPAGIMTQWLTHHDDCPEDFVIADTCKLIGTVEEGIVNCQRQDLLTQEIQEHLRAGKLVTRLALEWHDRLSFIVDEHFLIKRLKFLSVVEEHQDKDEPENYAEWFDAEFAIMTLEIAALITRLLEVFGGEDEEAYAEDLDSDEEGDEDSDAEED